MNEILTHINLWFRSFRPELTKEEKAQQAQKAYEEISEFVDLDNKGSRIILINEYLIEHYHYSAYNLVKNIFEKNLPNEYKTFLYTAIFYSMNDGILNEAVKKGIFPYRGVLLEPEKFQDPQLEQRLLPIIRDHVLEDTDKKDAEKHKDKN